MLPVRECSKRDFTTAVFYEHIKFDSCTESSPTLPQCLSWGTPEKYQEVWLFYPLLRFVQIASASLYKRKKERSKNYFGFLLAFLK